MGLPSLRLKGDYLAIVTLGFGEIIRVIFLNTQSLGGARGMYGIAGPSRPSIFLAIQISAFFMSCWMAYLLGVGDDSWSFVALDAQFLRARLSQYT